MYKTSVFVGITQVTVHFRSFCATPWCTRGGNCSCSRVCAFPLSIMPHKHIYNAFSAPFPFCCSPLWVPVLVFVSGIDDFRSRPPEVDPRTGRPLLLVASHSLRTRARVSMFGRKYRVSVSSDLPFIKIMMDLMYFPRYSYKDTNLNSCNADFEEPVIICFTFFYGDGQE